MNKIPFSSFNEMQKNKKKIVKYDYNCVNCGSNDTFPYMNSVDSTRLCEKCNISFKPKIISIKEYVEEKWW